MCIHKPVLKYYGAKWRLSRWIIEHFPVHYCYVEPFGGSAAVLLNKTPSEIEVYNDLGLDVYTFFKVLRTQKNELIEQINLTPWSREEFMRSNVEVDCSDLERARRFYVRCWQSYAHSKYPSWSFQHSDNGTKIVDRWNDTSHFDFVVDRLKLVQFENRPAAETIKRFDTEKTLFYVDPPYLLSTRSTSKSDAQKNNYDHEMTDQQHVDLLDKLNGCKGMIALSGYDNSLYNGMLAGWTRYEKTTTDNSNGSATEILWLSPNCQSNLVSVENLPLFSQTASDYGN